MWDTKRDTEPSAILDTKRDNKWDVIWEAIKDIILDDERDTILGSLKVIHNSLGLAPTWSTKPGNKYTKKDIKADTNC